MLSVLLKFKKVLLGLLIAAISLNPITSYADTDVVIRNNDTSSVEVYIRSGEWSNEKEAKPGKRIYLNSDEYFKTRIRVRKDENGYFISEADINKEVASKLNEKLIEKGVKTKSIKMGNDPNLEKINKLAEEQMQQKRITTIPWSVIIAVIIIAIIWAIL